ncbi:MAG: DNA repair protein RecN [Verrucomicrobiota bacterium]
MLQFLKISNLALLESATIEFEEGFTVVTGETGAGKSVFLGALSLLSGSRTDKSVIRSGTEQCEVEASLWFEDSEEIDRVLEENGLPRCEEGSLLLKRSLHVKKPSRISVNGSIATLANLEALGGSWIDFHGPGEPQRLLHSECQLELIDLFARLESEAIEYRKGYEEWRTVLAKIDRLQNETRLSADQIDFLKTQIEQIDRLELTTEAIEELELDFNRVSSGQDLLELSNELSHSLTGEGGVMDQLSNLLRASKEAADMDPSLSEVSERLNSVAFEVQELGGEYEQVGSSLNFEPEFAAEVQEKMGIWQDLRRKHGRTVADVIAAKDEMVRRLGDQGDIDGTLARLLEEADGMEKRLRGLAAKLTVKRRKAGEKLAKKAEETLLDLGFKKGRCAIAFVEQKGLKPFGDSLPELQFSPNVGEPLQPLSKIASSGELARVMLALKTILADVDEVPVLVFDEVDANVGGEIGRTVGEKMKEIGQGHQVICITHLPQVASLGHEHFVVQKDQSGERAAVSISKLDSGSEERVSELARMLGDRNAVSAQSHAKELLAAK